MNFLAIRELRGARFFEVKLQSGDLREANLQDAELIKADLRGANLEGANLEGADLRGVELQGASPSFLQDLACSILRRHTSLAALFEMGAKCSNVR
jgi:uncharacterized protein YjbI with pentapeptide repeats